MAMKSLLQSKKDSKKQEPNAFQENNNTAKSSLPPPLQLSNSAATFSSPVQEKSEDSFETQKDNGLPSALRKGVEAISGFNMGDVQVHYNSAQPAQLKAHAFAQGNNIHLGPGQEKHLPHEAWHVVQQKQGRVQPTVQMKDQMINDDQSLETEADTMGAKTLAFGNAESNSNFTQPKSPNFFSGVAQLFKGVVQMVKPASKAKALETVNKAGDYYQRGKIGGGKPFYNKEKRLPQGRGRNRIRYTEYDVNPYNGRGRDAERIVVGSNGKVYYTGDHYSSFEEI